MRKRAATILAALLCSAPAVAQTAYDDAIAATKSVMMEDPGKALVLARRAEAEAAALPAGRETELGVARAQWLQGEALSRLDQGDHALPILEKALAIDKSMLPADHKSIASVESELALARSVADNTRSGERMARAAYDRLKEKYGADNDYTVAAKGRLDKILALPEH